jgi:hypothetical protein
MFAIKAPWGKGPNGRQPTSEQKPYFSAESDLHPQRHGHWRYFSYVDAERDAVMAASTLSSQDAVHLPPPYDGGSYGHISTYKSRRYLDVLFQVRTG